MCLYMKGEKALARVRGAHRAIYSGALFSDFYAFRRLEYIAGGASMLRHCVRRSSISTGMTSLAFAWAMVRRRPEYRRKVEPLLRRMSPYLTYRAQKSLSVAIGICRVK